MKLKSRQSPCLNEWLAIHYGRLLSSNHVGARILHSLLSAVYLINTWLAGVLILENGELLYVDRVDHFHITFDSVNPQAMSY